MQRWRRGNLSVKDFVLFRAWSRWKKAAARAGFTILGMVLLVAVGMQAEDGISRRVKSKVAPVYPALARRSNMNITGTVKIHVVVAPDGNIKESKVVGGHPLLVGAAMDALRKWKFEPASGESSGTVEFNFAAPQ